MMHFVESIAMAFDEVSGQGSIPIRQQQHTGEGVGCDPDLESKIFSRWNVVLVF